MHSKLNRTFIAAALAAALAMTPYRSAAEPRDGNTVTSGVNPALASVLYPLGKRVMIPSHFGDVSVKGLENLPREGAVILAPNHSSRWDAPLVAAAASRRVDRRDLRFMTRQDQLKGPQGWMVKGLGGFAVGQGSARAAYTHSVELLGQRRKLVVFPEGKINRGNQVGRLKPGVARIALKAAQHRKKVSVVPVGIRYSDPHQPRGSKVELTFGKPMDASAYAALPRKEAARKLTDDLGQALRRLTRPAPWSPEQRPSARKGGTASSTVLSNVRWGFDEAATPDQWRPRFRDTAVPNRGVKDVYLVLEPFPPESIAAHAMLAFSFPKQRRMAAADGSGKHARGLVLSVEARLRQGQPYSLLKGMGKSFGLVYQLGTWRDMVQKSTRQKGHRLERYKLKLNQQQKDALLTCALKSATRDRTGEYYHTTNNSCYSNVVRLINKVAPRKQRVRPWLVPRVLPNPRAVLPKMGPGVLGRKGLLDPRKPQIFKPRRVAARK